MSHYLIAAYEAGGADVVASWLRYETGVTPWFLLEGPAVGVFQRRFPDLVVHTREETFAELDRFEKVITSTGTGQAADLTATVIERAKAAKILVCAFLDHWVNYVERFQARGRVLLPDEIWVADPDAEALAKRCFGDLLVRLVPSRYLADQVDEIAKLAEPARRSGALRILYLADTANPKVLGYDEFEAIKGYLRHLTSRNLTIEGIRVRLHPNEPAGKYAGVLAEFSGHFPMIESGAERATLPEDIAWADWVVGCDTMALVVGVHAGKKVFSCIPPGGKPMTLPFPQIERVFSR